MEEIVKNYISPTKEVIDIIKNNKSYITLVDIKYNTLYNTEATGGDLYLFITSIK